MNVQTQIRFLESALSGGKLTDKEAVFFQAELDKLKKSISPPVDTFDPRAYRYDRMRDFSVLEGEILVSVIQGENGDSEECLTFTTKSGKIFEMYHDQNCCESVYIEEIIGDLDRLIGGVILTAKETSNQSYRDDYDSFTYTFYTLVTNLDSVTIRWYGSSNGYYSESVSFYRTK